MFLCICLTLFRVLISPFFVFLYLRQTSFLILFFLAFLCELTDFLDGFLARQWNCTSALGKLLDPLSDSFWHLSALFAFTQGEMSIPIWIPLISLWRDLLMCLLRLLYALEGHPLQAQRNAKVKSACWGISIILFLCGLKFIELSFISKRSFKRIFCVFFSLNCLLSWNTLIGYYVQSLQILKLFFRNSNL